MRPEGSSTSDWLEPRLFKIDDTPAEQTKRCLLASAFLIQ